VSAKPFNLTTAEIEALLIERIREVSESTLRAASRELSERFRQKALAEELRKAAERKERLRRSDEAARDGFLAAEGCYELIYLRDRKPVWTDGREWPGRHGEGVVRIPATGKWMYARFTPKGSKDCGIRYFRHHRLELMPANGASVLVSYQVVTQAWLDAERQRINDWSAKRRERIERFSKFTVEQCRSALQKAHPDRGGNPADFEIWKARLDAAKSRRRHAQQRYPHQ